MEVDPPTKAEGAPQVQPGLLDKIVEVISGPSLMPTMGANSTTTQADKIVEAAFGPSLMLAMGTNSATTRAHKNFEVIFGPPITPVMDSNSTLTQAYKIPVPEEIAKRDSPFKDTQEQFPEGLQEWLVHDDGQAAWTRFYDRYKLYIMPRGNYNPPRYMPSSKYILLALVSKNHHHPSRTSVLLPTDSFRLPHARPAARPRDWMISDHHETYASPVAAQEPPKL